MVALGFNGLGVLAGPMVLAMFNRGSSLSVAVLGPPVADPDLDAGLNADGAGCDEAMTWMDGWPGPGEGLRLSYELDREFARDEVSETLLYDADGDACLEGPLAGGSRCAGPDELVRMGLMLRLAAPPNEMGGVPAVLE